MITQKRDFPDRRSPVIRQNTISYLMTHLKRREGEMVKIKRMSSPDQGHYPRTDQTLI